MTFSPPVLPQEKVIEQVKGLHQQKDHLQTHLDQIEEKLKMIEQSLSENDHLKAKVRELLELSFNHFNEEWKRRSEYYPDLRLASLEKLVALYPVAAPKK